MGENFWKPLDKVIGRIFQNEADKRIEDLNKFEEFVKIVNPQIIHNIYVSLAKPILFDHYIDVFQYISDFYSTPDSEFHSPKLQKRSLEFKNAFEELSDLTELHFLVNAQNPNLYQISYNAEDWESRQELTTRLLNLSWKFAQTYRHFYSYGKKRLLSRTERFVISFLVFIILVVLVLSVATLFTRAVPVPVSQTASKLTYD